MGWSAHGFANAPRNFGVLIRNFPKRDGLHESRPFSDSLLLRNDLFLGGQLLCGNGAGGARLVSVFDFGPDLLSLLFFTAGRVEVRER